MSDSSLKRLFNVLHTIVVYKYSYDARLSIREIDQIVDYVRDGSYTGGGFRIFDIYGSGKSWGRIEQNT